MKRLNKLVIGSILTIILLQSNGATSQNASSWVNFSCKSSDNVEPRFSSSRPILGSYKIGLNVTRDSITDFQISNITSSASSVGMLMPLYRIYKNHSICKSKNSRLTGRAQIGSELVTCMPMLGSDGKYLLFAFFTDPKHPKWNRRNTPVGSITIEDVIGVQDFRALQNFTIKSGSVDTTLMSGVTSNATCQRQ